MKITEVTEDYILFDDDSRISYYHDQDCCEDNYADFKSLEERAYKVDFKEPLEFEPTPYGFRFGNKPSLMFFIPCYSVQNGYYSPDLEILYKGQTVIESLECNLTYARS